MNIYVVKEKIHYEGDNIWVVAAENMESAINLTDAIKHNWPSASFICSSSKTEEEILWQN